MLTIHQPNYWAYPGLIGKIMRSDKFLYLTKVQFDKSSWQNRNRIRVKEGWKYISVPVENKGKDGQLIADVKISNMTNWRNQHLNAIKFAYQKAPYYDEYFPFLKELYSKKWSELQELDIFITNFVLKELESKTEILYDRDFNFEGEKNELLIDICHKLDEKEYMSNKGSENYVDIEKFNESGIQHIYINYDGAEYSQVYDGFEPGLSVLDMLLNCGPEKTKQIIMNDNNYTFSEWNKKIGE
ncbi:MAG: WbqC family protein [Lachnospiraceae bacterium]|nr:WbqC family protein [Lachnospiraceae bacterium]